MRVIFSFLLGLTTLLLAQSNWTVQTVDGRYYSHASQLEYQSPTLTFQVAGKAVAVHRDSILVLKKEGKGGFGEGFLVGAFSGMLAMMAISNGKSDNPIAVVGNTSAVVGGTVVGGAIGGLFGLLRNVPERYEIVKMPVSEKERFLSHFNSSKK